jgi:hypothetical protein
MIDMPTAPTIKNRHQGHDEWLARAIAHYTAMTTAALAERLRERAGLLTGWDASERAVIYEVLEKRHPEVDAATWEAHRVSLQVDDTAVILAAIDALPAAELARTGGQ